LKNKFKKVYNPFGSKLQGYFLCSEPVVSALKWAKKHYTTLVYICEGVKKEPIKYYWCLS